ncbi:Putative Holliday junction resolvase [Gossypium arboreum]|uniref:Putative Holliday junction resolvase n=1 Tax=Gossypium arboreum TaxID=29729 RepID=A0A0B0NEY4_GOSAR|nr:Putative Holliday junction resolvase [Gossypium arboreum]
MPKSPQNWPFLNWTQLGFGRDTPVAHARVRLLQAVFEPAKLTRLCCLTVPCSSLPN